MCTAFPPSFGVREVNNTAGGDFLTAISRQPARAFTPLATCPKRVRAKFVGLPRGRFWGVSMQKLAKFGIALSGTLLASLAPAGAQESPAGAFAQGSGPNGWYLRAGAGGAWPASPGGYASSLGQSTTDVSPGFIVGGAAGYKFNAFRAELELEYIQVGIKSLSFYNTGTTINTTGTQSNLAGMANGYWDFATGTPWVPYLGFGVGIAELGMNNIANASSGKSILNTTAATFAFQGMLGVKYNMNNQWAAGAEFRYFKTPDGWFINSDGLSTSAGNAQYNLLVSLTYNFGTPK